MMASSILAPHLPPIKLVIPDLRGDYADNVYGTYLRYSGATVKLGATVMVPIKFYEPPPFPRVADPTGIEAAMVGCMLYGDNPEWNTLMKIYELAQSNPSDDRFYVTDRHGQIIAANDRGRNGESLWQAIQRPPRLSEWPIFFWYRPNGCSTHMGE